ncbi:hypothetical protein LLEC1_00647 [Akanthomyces lecanii]|uniref:Uncharacterized protein n=1 Tax=Cordyceps confragosa TaxID=2714763 RepID=A0A179I3N3_CORDF|nr:hypothetical protein LLEC1_00647 [Akanthomyces lecanii]
MANIRLLPMPGGTVSPQLLDPAHHEAFQMALSRLLSTENARETVAQLMDGLPLYHILRGTAGVNNLSGAPIQQHTALCEGSTERADEFISSFDVNLLQLSASLLQAFQHSKPGTDRFLFRLLELLSRSVHCIAVSIELTATKCHAGDIEAATTYQQPPMMVPVGKNIKAYPSPPPHGSLFFHRRYKDHEQYPFGKADMAGYWAEDRIFGGVVLVASGTETHSVWLHSGRKGWTKRIWKPLDWQLRAMANFFSGSSADTIVAEIANREQELPPRLLEEMNENWRLIFPFFCDVDNPDRHDDYDAMAYHNIYRDPWERQLPPENPQPCTQNTFDYPELQAVMEAIMFYPGPDTIPTEEDLNYPRDLSLDERNRTAEASDPIQSSGRTASRSSRAECGAHTDSDVSDSQRSGSNADSPSKPSVWNSPGRKAAIQIPNEQMSEGSQKSRYSETVIGRFEGGKFVHADPSFDIHQTIDELVQGRRREDQRKMREEERQRNDRRLSEEGEVRSEGQ